MEITKLGKNCFRIKGKKAIILIEPSSEIKNLTAHIVITSSTTETQVKGEPVIIFGPGEYEIRGITILGFREKFGKFYKIDGDGFSVLYVSDLQENIPEEKLEIFNHVDILLLPVGKPKIASALVSELEPTMIILTDEEKVEEFLKEVGTEKVEKLDKLVFTKEELPEERKIVLLKSG
ncbi:MBL fold metallo-hydrolase [Candidatus Microgenomates bacterium]|nr:MBL fold metallo-hydrolase [Candidatus Microgenomates bacterium]